MPDDTDKTVDDILRALNLEGWAAITGDATDAIRQAARAGGREALLTLGISEDDSADLFSQVDADALDFAAKRGAELVGMRIDEDGNLIVNPDARWAITDGTRALLRATVRQAIEEGQSAKQLADAVRDSYAFSEARAQAVGRTEIARAVEAGNLAGWKKSGVVKRVRWLLGSEHDSEHDPDECLVEGTSVRAWGVSRAYARRYSGPLVRLYLANGLQLAGTPNHPVLTDVGWRPISSIDEGSYLVDGEWAKRTALIADDFVEVITSIENIARALNRTATSVESTASDFHGDGVGSQVHTIATHGFLRSPLTPQRAEESEQSSLCGGIERAATFSSNRNGGMSGDHSSHSLSSGRATVPIAESFGPRSTLDAVSSEPAYDCLAAGSEKLADFVRRQLAIIVEKLEVRERASAAVRVQRIERYSATADVYNLGTVHGFFIASGIVVSNCDDNADAGALELGDAFPSGDDAPPAHPNCECALVAETDEGQPEA